MSLRLLELLWKGIYIACDHEQNFEKLNTFWSVTVILMHNTYVTITASPKMPRKKHEALKYEKKNLPCY